MRDFANNNIKGSGVNLRPRDGRKKLNTTANFNDAVSKSSNNSISARSSPRLASKQRAVLLPLLKEKDTVIANLEEKIVDLEAKVISDDSDKFKDILEEKSQLEENYITLGA